MSMLRVYQKQVNHLFFTVFSLYFNKYKKFKKYTTFLSILFYSYYLKIFLFANKNMQKSAIITCFFNIFDYHTRIIKDITQKGKLKLTFRRSYLHHYVVYPSMKAQPFNYSTSFSLGNTIY